MSLVETVKGLTNTYHAYVFGTAFWYALRGLMRIIDPHRVASWFRPPISAKLGPNGIIGASDLEIYNIWTDGWGLIAMAMLLVALCDAVPLPASFVGSALTEPGPSKTKKPYARAAVAITLFHHISTGIGAYQHWKLETHHTIAMDIGVYGNIGLTILGTLALVFGLKDAPEEGHKKIA